MIDLQLPIDSTLRTPRLHSLVILDVLYMELHAQHVKHQGAGVNKHQHVEVVNLLHQNFS